jgi:hypothetical protein
MKRHFIRSSLTTSLITGALLVAAVLATAHFTDLPSQADEPKSAAPATDSKNAQEKSPASQNDSSTLPSQAELEKKFQEALSGATLEGHFTSNRDAGGTPPQEDKYTIQSVTKMQGDIWLFTARIQYGAHDVTLPLPLRVVWAGDTPVITLDKLPIPGIGSFTARVMIFDGKYAGMWDGGNHGGLLFGKLTKQAAGDGK